MKNLYRLITILLIGFSTMEAYGQLPTIVSFTPASGPVGTPVTITGTNFNTTAASNLVSFGATNATVTSATPTSLVVTVPAGATYQPISVCNLTSRLTAYSLTPFITTFTTHNSIGASDIDVNVDFQSATNPNAVAIADIDGDGKSDVIIANATSASFSVELNRSAGVGIGQSSFNQKVDFITNNNPSAMVVGDVNGDGKPDVVVVYQTTNTVSVYVNASVAGTPTFNSRLDYATDGTSNSVALGDIDGDGKPDIIVANFSTNTVSVLRNASTVAGAASFSARVSFATGLSPNSVAVADLNGDGKPDVVVSNFAGKSLSVFQNKATTGITTLSLGAKLDFAVAGSPTDVIIGNIDRSGYPDLIVTNYTPTKNAVTILRNTLTVTGNLALTSFAAGVDFTTGTEPVAVTIGDIDGDGNMDILTANYGSKNVSVFRNTATAGSITASSLAAKVDFAAGGIPNGVAVGDLDNDGKPDIVSANTADNTISVLHNFNTSSAPGPTFPESTAAASVGSFVNVDLMDTEWKQEAPPLYTVAGDDGVATITGTTANAGRFAYFSTQGSAITPVVNINGTLTFTAMGSGTIEVQIIYSGTPTSSIAQRKTFVLTSSFQDYSWKISALAPQKEYILAVVFNGVNTTPNASGQFKKNMCLNLQQAGISGYFTRYRADVNTLIGNAETVWYGWSDNLNASRLKYLQHSAYSRMRFQTTATQITMEYVRDFYDKDVINLFPLAEAQNAVDWDTNGNIVAGYNVINSATKVTGGKTYVISGLTTSNPTFVWLANGSPIAPPQSLSTHQVQVPSTAPVVYSIIAPANATGLGLLIQRTTDPGDIFSPGNDTYFAYTQCMVQEGAYGSVAPDGSTIPSAYTPYAGNTPSFISGPAVFINGVLYKYYQVEGSDIAKIVQYVTDQLPPGNKTVEVMMPGQGTYSVNNVMTDPHIRRSGTFLRAVYFPGTATTVAAITPVKANSVLFIHDSILSGFNISSDAQNNVWMMKIVRDPQYGFTGDVFSEGYAGRILHTDTDPTHIAAFAQKLANYGTANYWFQIGVNDYGFKTPIQTFYSEYKSLIEQLHTLKPTAVIYIQCTGPESYEGPNGETMADNGLVATGPTANDYRDIQRAIATGPLHTYCRYVDFEHLFSYNVGLMADGIHPTDAGNELYAAGIQSQSALLGNTVEAQALRFNPYRTAIRQFIQTKPGISIITADGGKPQYTFSLVSGALPTGLTFNNDGTITGTPSQSGIFPLNVKVTDALAANVTANFTLIVNPTPTVVAIPLLLMNGKVGLLYTKQFHGASGYGPYTLTHSGTIPPGLTFNDATGVLSGTPTTVTGSPFHFTVSAVDHYGFAGSTSYTFTVGTTTPPPITDTYSVTASIGPGNHLILTAHLNDLYTTTLFGFIEGYFTQGGTEYFVGGNLVNVESDSKDGAPVDFGPIGLTAGAFSVRMQNDGISQPTLDGVNINYNASTTQSLSTTLTSPTELYTLTAAVDGNGHLIVTGHMPNAHTMPVLASVGAYITNNGNITYAQPAGNVTINANSANGVPIDFGLLPAGNSSVRLFIGAFNPTSVDGVLVSYNTNTVVSLTR